MIDASVIVILIAGIVLADQIGSWLGRRQGGDGDPFDD